MTESPAAGGSIVRAAWWGTGAFAVTATVATAYPEPPAEGLALGAAVALFLAGCVVFAVAFARAVARSRTELVGVAEVFLLTGKSVPTDIRRHLRGALLVQVALALATAIARPYSSLAAGTLVPVYGIGLCGLWAARHGRFPARHRGEGPAPGRHR